MSNGGVAKPSERGEKKGIKRDRKTMNRLKMYNTKPIRDRKGKVVYEQYQSKDTTHQARIEPNRKWFGPVRTVTQTQLSTFREELKKQQSQPNTYLLRAAKVPYSLLRDNQQEGKVNLLEVESFDTTFGKKRTRKRPRLSSYTMEALAQEAQEKETGYKKEEDVALMEEEEFKDKSRDVLFTKGQSHRIWNELYKVIDSSDVVIQVVDARDPLGTRCGHVEKYLKDNCPHKHLVLVLNKCDLIPVWATKRWVYTLSKEYPTVAVHASITKPFGKGTLIQLLRQFQRIHNDKPQISVGFIGYPNVGKSSIINMLRSKKVCKVAPIPGETKVWQYITLFKKIFLIDCPGIVTPAREESEDNIVLKGVVRVENLLDPTVHIPALLERCKKEHIQKTYGIMDWKDATDFLELYAQKTGKLLRKGEPDITAVSKMVLNDWIRGKIPFFVGPPDDGFVPEVKDTVPTRAEALKKGSTTTTVYEGVRSEPRKKDVRQPQQVMSGLKVREEFKENDDANSMEYKSDVSEFSDEENSQEGGDSDEAGMDEEDAGESEEKSGEESSSGEPNFEDLV